MTLAFDRFVNNIEVGLSKAAVAPVVGTVAGALKISAGVIQIVVFSILGTIVRKPYLKDYAWTHIEHGCGNIFAGLLEAIPLVGTALYFYRELLYLSADDIPNSWFGKFMPYDSLARDDRAHGRVYTL